MFVNPPRSSWPRLTTRADFDDSIIESRVEAIIKSVREGSDDALRTLSQEIEGFVPERFEVTPEEVAEAAAQVPQSLKEALERAAANIRAFHEAQMPCPVCVETVPGVRCIQRPTPIRKVGLYIPGGSAPLFSTVLMLAIPAKVAQCGEIVLCTPAARDGKVNATVLYAASQCGVTRIFKLGGAQAIAAMAYGTESIPKVDKIFGPGNRYVMKAKEIVSRHVAIDMPAGPSEVLVLADSTARAAFVASDLLSQAEHGPDSQAMLVCESESFALEVREEVGRQLALLPRSAIASKALSNSRLVVIPDGHDRIDFVNAYAPEHLIISTADAWAVAGRITDAGSVFMGNWSPESAGDYASGTNHTLPTSGWARSCSGVNIGSFIKKITYQEITEQGLRNLGDTIIEMAEAEGLQAHAEAVRTRRKAL